MAMPPPVSFEFVPPAPGAPEQRFLKALDQLAVLRPNIVSITYGAGGTTQDRPSRALDLLTGRCDVKPAAHITRANASRVAVDKLAAEWAQAGISRLVALRGDEPEPGACFRPRPDGYRNSTDLVAGLNMVAHFGISVACHPDANSPDADLENLKQRLMRARAAPFRSIFSMPRSSCGFASGPSAPGSRHRCCLASWPCSISTRSSASARPAAPAYRPGCPSVSHP